MSSKEIRVPVKGEMVPGVEVPIKEAKEYWNEYTLEDGTIIKMKLVVVRVVRTNIYDSENDPVYYITSQNIVNPTVDDNLKKR